MKSDREEILKILENLLKSEDVHACMLVTRGMTGIVPETEKFNREIIPIWEILQKTMDDLFIIIKEYSKYNIGEIYIKLMNYEIVFFVLPSTSTALVAISPTLSNRGLLMMELEKARTEIIKILK